MQPRPRDVTRSREEVALLVDEPVPFEDLERHVLERGVVAEQRFATAALAVAQLRRSMSLRRAHFPALLGRELVRVRLLRPRDRTPDALRPRLVSRQGAAHVERAVAGLAERAILAPS